MTKLSNNYAFILGREELIALAELESVLDRQGFSYSIFSVAKNIAFINITGQEISNVADLTKILGGTLKIFYLEERSDSLVDSVFALIKDRALEQGRKLDFGVSVFSSGPDLGKINRMGLVVKKRLQADGLSARFVQSKEPILSTILSLKNKLAERGAEIGIFTDFLGRLIAVNNPEEWSKRDYEKPAGDKYSGMVPPKLARMMVNLALGSLGFRVKSKEVKALNEDQPDEVVETLNTKPSTPNCLVFDPFCGSGNILMEALLLGCDVFGSDVSEKAVKDTKDNISWLNAESQTLEPSSEVVVADATDELLVNNLITTAKNYGCLAVVAEPYLGKPKKIKPTFRAAETEYMEIKELYIKFLINFSKLKAMDFKPTFCLIFPYVMTSDSDPFSLFDRIVDEIREIGYTLIRPPLTYGRDYQIVKRQIVLLQFTRKEN